MLVLKIIGYVLLAIVAVILLFLAFLGVIALAVDPKKEYNTHSRFYRTMLNFCTDVVMWLGNIHFEVEGAEKIPESGRIMMVSNHKSNYDPLICWDVFKQYDLAFISKEANFHIPFFGRMIRKCCFMSVDRENARNALETVNRAIGLLNNDTVSIAAYPEGTRNKNPGYSLLPFRPGLFKVAQKAGVPIVVITMKGTPEIRYLIKRNVVRIHVLEVIDAETVKSTRTADLAERIAAEMEADLAA